MAASLGLLRAPPVPRRPTGVCTVSALGRQVRTWPEFRQVLPPVAALGRKSLATPSPIGRRERMTSVGSTFPRNWRLQARERDGDGEDKGAELEGVVENDSSINNASARREPEEPSTQSLQPPPTQAQQEQEQEQRTADGSPLALQPLSLDDVNPVGLGRRSRQFLDDVWRRLLELGQLSRPIYPAGAEDEQEALIQGPNCEFAIPNAQFTKVLVVGPTGRVGRVLVRKLLLRGYSVRVLVRRADFATMEQLPGAVEVMETDFEGAVNNAALLQAVQGCQKVIYCATARTPSPECLRKVDEVGVVMVAKALLDYHHHLAQRRAGRSSKSKVVVVKLKKERYQQGWKLREGRLPTPNGVASFADPGLAEDALAADAEFEVTEEGHGLFQGYVVERGGYVEVKRVLEMPEGLTLDRFEGLVLRVVGDGKAYSLVLECESPNAEGAEGQDLEDSWNGMTDWAASEEDDEGAGRKRRGATQTIPRPRTRKDPTARAFQYIARFSTRVGPSTVRIPFTAFRPEEVGLPPFNPGAVTSMALRFEQKRPRVPAAGAPKVAPSPSSAQSATDPYSFKVELDFIKAFPGGDETDFILVSCTGAAVPEEAREAVLKAKLAAEAQLRASGLGYTIIRPGPLFEEPGGRRALVFDQGNRISEGISCADVADVCVKALHDPLARNKSFDICYEHPDASGLYELVAHLPDKANNFLTPALALLEKNT